MMCTLSGEGAPGGAVTTDARNNKMKAIDHADAITINASFIFGSIKPRQLSRSVVYFPGKEGVYLRFSGAGVLMREATSQTHPKTKGP
jgi:hypothetical protein